ERQRRERWRTSAVHLFGPGGVGIGGGRSLADPKRREMVRRGSPRQPRRRKPVHARKASRGAPSPGRRPGDAQTLSAGVVRKAQGQGDRPVPHGRARRGKVPLSQGGRISAATGKGKRT